MKLKSTIGRIMSVTLASVMLFNVTPLATATKAETKPAVVNEMIESFRVDTLSDTKNAEGFYEETGFKDVNTVTTFYESGNISKTESEIVEDYYDENGNFIKSVSQKVVYENDYSTGKAKASESKKEFDQPKAIKAVKSKDKKLSNESDVKNHVKSNMNFA